MHHALVMIWLFVLLKAFQQRGWFRDSRVIGVRGLPSILPFLNALTFVDHPQVAGES